MNKEEIEKRIDFCEKKARDYREIGKNFIANKYDDEKYKWEKLLSDLDLLEKRKINELLEYKKGYYKQKEVIDKIEKYIEKQVRMYGLSIPIELGTHLDNILGILKEVSK